MNRTFVFGLAVEFLVFAGITWAVNRWLGMRRRKRRLERQVRAFMTEFDADLDILAAIFARTDAEE